MIKKLVTSFALSSLFLLTSCVENIKKDVYEKNKILKIDTGISNIYLITGKKNILVDASEHGKEKEVINKLKDLGYQPKDISLLILTHGHGDHSGGAKFFKDTYKIPVLIGKNDEVLTKRGHNDDLKPTSLLSVILKPFIKSEYPAFNPDIIIDKDFDLSDYGVDGKIIYTPSHTEGSVIVIVGKTKALVGDLVRGGITFNQIPQVHFFHNDLKKVNKTLKLLLEQGIDDFYTGHFGPLKANDIKKEFFSKKK